MISLMDHSKSRRAGGINSSSGTHGKPAPGDGTARLLTSAHSVTAQLLTSVNRRIVSRVVTSLAARFLREFTPIYDPFTGVYSDLRVLIVFFAAIWRFFADIWTNFARKWTEFDAAARRPRRTIPACDDPDSTRRSRRLCLVGTSNRCPHPRRWKWPVRIPSPRLMSDRQSSQACAHWGVRNLYGFVRFLYGFVRSVYGFWREMQGFLDLGSRRRRGPNR